MPAGDLVIRPATADDAVAAAHVQREAALAAYRPIFPPSAEPPSVEWMVRNWRDLVAAADGALVATVPSEGGIVVGTVVARTDPDDPTFGQLHRLYVVPARWKGGVGAALHDAALDRMRERGFARAALWVLEGNARARAMYERRGWRLVPGATSPTGVEGVVEVRYERGL